MDTTTRGTRATPEGDRAEEGFEPAGIGTEPARVGGVQVVDDTGVLPEDFAERDGASGREAEFFCDGGSRALPVQENATGGFF